jgi:SAM-dependent methyltransferase
MYEVEDRHWWYVSLHERILELVGREARRLGRPLEIFDAGCGTGRLAQLLSRERHRVTGCDASDEAIRLCRQRGLGGILRADLNTIELVPDSCDVITAIDVLYHADIVDDVGVMRRLGRALRPGGLLLLHLVADESLRSTHDVAVHTRERYTRSTLHARLREAGLWVEDVRYRVGLLFPLIALHRRGSRAALRARPRPEEVASDVAMPHPAVNALLLGIGRLENRLPRWVRLPRGSSLLATARRAPPGERVP